MMKRMFGRAAFSPAGGWADADLVDARPPRAIRTSGIT
jgi:hypothetical protein